MRIYAYVTSETCTTQRAIRPGTQIHGRGVTVSRCGDYEPWTLGKRATLRICADGGHSGIASVRTWKCARLVAVLLDWKPKDGE